jgi:uroporphyrinogen decarboxylase
LWRHWPGDDQRITDFAWSTLAFQKTFDWDFVKTTPFSAYCVADYGVRTEWRGDVSGDRFPLKHPVSRSLAWTELKTLDPLRGEQGKYLESLRLIGDGLSDLEVPMVATIYSPLSQAAVLSGDELMLSHMRIHTDRLRTALNTITESTLRFIDAVKRTSVVGIVFVMRHASFSFMSEEEYQAISMPYDLKILETLPPKWWLNIVQLQCRNPMFRLVATYPVPVITWDTPVEEPAMQNARAFYQGALCGGLSYAAHLHQGTPAMIRDVAREVFEHMGTRRFILSTGDAVPVSTPLSNLRAVREVADEMRAGS